MFWRPAWLRPWIWVLAGAAGPARGTWRPASRRRPLLSRAGRGGELTGRPALAVTARPAGLAGALVSPAAMIAGTAALACPARAAGRPAWTARGGAGDHGRRDSAETPAKGPRWDS
ncbi:MAG TPA: hypothetical protein VFV41_12560 [Streptosporangiaceae bacterium]|nr:hypothetical protein [Streptosporangiaceae bacterium]